MVDRVGQRFGDYRLKRLISDRGASADVYEGEHVVNQTKAAVKIWKVQIKPEAFLNDVHAIVLDHPHIVKIRDFGIKGDIPYLVMAYATNGSLQAQQLPLPLDRIVSYVRDIANALYYAHQLGIVHRDIKPDNILLGPKKEIWVGDFGIATPSYTRQDTIPEEPKKRIIGTLAYMAPEQWEDQPSSASDQYALGVMVYEWLCGERPFRGNEVALYQKHANEPPPPLCEKYPTISPAGEQVIMKALEKNPENRFPSVRAFADALEACLPKPGRLLRTYHGHSGPVCSIAWSPDGKCIATASHGYNSVQFWEVTSGQQIFTWALAELSGGSRATPHVVVWSPDGRQVAVGTTYAWVYIFDAHSGEKIASIRDLFPRSINLLSNQT